MSKIIGFFITSGEVNLKIDFFNAGLKILKICVGEFTVFLWGLGDIKKNIIDNKYTLSFPITESLLDRNVLIYFENDKIFVENDWLGSIPVFYNKKEGLVSTLPNLCLKDKALHKEGLANFCEFGYSVFEQTMFRDVKFMRYFSKLKISKEQISLEYKEDPILDLDLDVEVDEKDVLCLIKEYINNVENEIEGDIILPISGGYDSRLLCHSINNKSRLQAYTYGVSEKQEESFEVVYAKKITEILNVKWKHIELNSYHHHIDAWFKLFGFSTHLHGMYQIEFYKELAKEKSNVKSSILSGIYGDLWAGSIQYKKLNSWLELHRLGYSHGLSLNKSKLANHEVEYKLKMKFYEDHKESFKNNKCLAIHTARFKIILISYLTQLPEYFGMPSWTPFLNFDIATSMLKINENHRSSRSWQRDYFKKIGLDIEGMGLKSKKDNRLNFDIARKEEFEKLNVSLLQDIIDYKALKNINREIVEKKSIKYFINSLLYVPKIGGVLRRLNIKNSFLSSLYEYYVAKAIEKGLENGN